MAEELQQLGKLGHVDSIERPIAFPSYGRGHWFDPGAARDLIRQNAGLPDLGGIGRGTIDRYGGAIGVLCAHPESSLIRAVFSRHGSAERGDGARPK
jgi:hypothetical protein